MHVAAGGILGRPDADGIVRNGVEIPELLAGLGVIGAHEAADAVFAAVGADQNLVLDHGRRHRLAVAELGIGDVGHPDHFAGLGVQRDQLGIEGGEIDLVVENLDAAIVGAAAKGRDRSHLVSVVPELLAGLGVKRVDMAERRRHVHHAIDDDRRRLEQFLDVGLENPGDTQTLDVVAIDLLGGIETCLGVIAVGEQKILRVLVGRVELLLGDRRHLGVAERRFAFLLDLLAAGGSGQKRDASDHGNACRERFHVLHDFPLLFLGLGCNATSDASAPFVRAPNNAVNDPEMRMKVAAIAKGAMVA